MLCVLAKIDENARKQLLSLQEKAVKHGIARRPLHGHITLAVYNGADTIDFIASCKQIFKVFKPFCIQYQSLKILREPSTISACPAKDGVLVQLQQRIASQWAAELNVWSQSDVWLPHTTLLHAPDADLDAVLQSMQCFFHPFTAQISTLEFSAVTPEGYIIVDTVELNA